MPSLFVASEGTFSLSRADKVSVRHKGREIIGIVGGIIGSAEDFGMEIVEDTSEIDAQDVYKAGDYIILRVAEEPGS